LHIPDAGLDGRSQFVLARSSPHQCHESPCRELQQGFAIDVVMVALLSSRLRVDAAAIHRAADPAVLSHDTVHNPTALAG